MAKKEKRGFGDDFRRFFGRGLAILLPSVLTLWLLVQAYFFLDRQVAEPINRGIRQGVLWVMPRTVADSRLPKFFNVTEEQMVQRRARLAEEGLKAVADSVVRNQIRQAQFKRFWDEYWGLRLIGLIVAIILIYLAGLLLGGYLGRQGYRRVEKLLTRIPGFKQVYPHVKQVVELILGDRPMAFRRVVLVEYPRKGIWTMGLVTSSSLKPVKEAFDGDEVLTIFIPSTPTPFTGFAINVRANETLDVAITIDEAIRFFITGGVLVPDALSNEQPEVTTGPGEAALAPTVVRPSPARPPPAPASAPPSAPPSAPQAGQPPPGAPRPGGTGTLPTMREDGGPGEETQQS